MYILYGHIEPLGVYIPNYLLVIHTFDDDRLATHKNTHMKLTSTLVTTLNPKTVRSWVLKGLCVYDFRFLGFRGHIGIVEPSSIGRTSLVPLNSKWLPGLGPAN